MNFTERYNYFGSVKESLLSFNLQFDLPPSFFRGAETVDVEEVPNIANLSRASKFSENYF